jgi:hypothetical protein
MPITNQTHIVIRTDDETKSAYTSVRVYDEEGNIEAEDPEQKMDRTAMVLFANWVEYLDTLNDPT